MFYSDLAASSDRSRGTKLFLTLAIAALPLQQAFTVDVGFPFKITEIATVFAVAAAIISGTPENRPWFFRPFAAAIAVLLVASLLVHLTYDGRLSVHPGYPSGLETDMISYSLYALFALTFCWAISVYLDTSRFAYAISCATVVCVIYCAAQLALWLIGAESVLMSFNGVTQYGTAFGVPIPRNGPFLEGNFLGFFGGTVLWSSVALRSRLTAVGGVVLVIYSQSTITILAVGLATLIFFIRVVPRSRNDPLWLAGFALSVSALIFLGPSGVVVRFLTKVGIVESRVDDRLDVSLASRTAAIRTAARMGTSNWAFGVGPGRYGYWFDRFFDGTSAEYFLAAGKSRPIVNNVYMQIYAELGLLPLLCFAAGLLSATIVLWRFRDPAVGLAVFVAIAVAAFPAWTALTLWAAVAAICLSIPGEWFEQGRRVGVNSLGARENQETEVQLKNFA